MLPKARQERLTTQVLPDETLVYDHERHKAHCLNVTAALVWRHCDGHTSLDELARRVAAEVRRDAGQGGGGGRPRTSSNWVGGTCWRRPWPRCRRNGRIGRRDALKSLAFVVALLLVMTVATKAAEAQTMSVECRSAGTARSVAAR